jgi:hypothetical protein
MEAVQKIEHERYCDYENNKCKLAVHADSCRMFKNTGGCRLAGYPGNVKVVLRDCQAFKIDSGENRPAVHK